MLGGPVQPATPGLGQHAEPVPLPHIRSFWSGPYGPSPPLHTLSNNHFPPAVRKRKASPTPLSDEHAAKKQSKWTPEEDNLIIQLRGQGTKWDDIANHLPGRSSISCRLRYQNYLEKRAPWDEEKKNKFAKCYERFKERIWQQVATEMGIPWRSAEWMHWQMGEQEIIARAKAPVFQPHSSTTSTGMSSSSQVPVIPASAPYGFTPSNAPQSMPQLHQVPPPMSQGPVPEMQSAIKRETENPNYTKIYHVREQKDKAAVSSQLEHETGCQGARSLDRISQRSATGSSKRIKREPEETERKATVPSVTQMCEFTVRGGTKLEPDS
ncbi:MYB DNA-binding-like protein [Alternaria alternata]|nr:MYB DNA-binding-like protein [Alternaria alternata]